MKTVKLNETQMEALCYLYKFDFTFAIWGEKTIPPLPQQVKSLEIIQELVDKKLVEIFAKGMFTNCVNITDDGRKICEVY